MSRAIYAGVTTGINCIMDDSSVHLHMLLAFLYRV